MNAHGSGSISDSADERVKELACLYEIAQLVAQVDLPLDEALAHVAEVLPPALQDPASATARIVLDKQSFGTRPVASDRPTLRSAIVVDGKRRGYVEVSYGPESKADPKEPFLPEERGLLDAVAKHLALIVRQKEMESERQDLQEQMRHADRLATIGQLAAGVAHELNEPLANVLGFAQLAQKSAGLPVQGKEDMEKIVVAALQAREVIGKLLTFARQSPPRKTPTSLNQIVDDALVFLAGRCARQRIEIIKSLTPDLPSVSCDAGQIHQVLVNLLVNAMQAMPKGGRITIHTSTGDGVVVLGVEDTGVGMSRDVLRRIFLPFFTTKDVNEGTGLGLAVVHGIVSAHDGKIIVQSRKGEGSRFEVSLPLSPRRRGTDRGKVG